MYKKLHCHIAVIDIDRVARTPPILVLSMAKTSPFHPGSPNSNNKQIKAPPKKKKVDGNDGVTRTLPTISTRSSRKDPPEQEPMPSCPVRGNRTPAPSPPKLLNIPGETYEDHSDPFHPLDHTNPESPIDLALLSKVAAAINTDDDDNQFSNDLQSIQSVGRKGSFGHAEDDSKDPLYKQPELEDDDLFNSDDELLDAEFERGLDEVARAIEWSDPK